MLWVHLFIARFAENLVWGIFRLLRRTLVDLKSKSFVELHRVRIVLQYGQDDVFHVPIGGGFFQDVQHMRTQTLSPVRFLDLHFVAGRERGHWSGRKINRKSFRYLPIEDCPFVVQIESEHAEGYRDISWNR